MNIKIIIKDPGKDISPREESFNRLPIIIGREDSCDITLKDSMKLVSRQHAQIIFSNDEFQVVDLVSRNSTFSNNIKLEPEKEHQINVGDKLKIGEFFLDIISLEKEIIEEDDSQKTMMFSSPFAEDVDNLNSALKSLSDKYSNSSEQMKSQYLRMDFLSNISKDNLEGISSILSEYFSDGNSTNEDESVKQSENKWSEIPNPEPAPKEKTKPSVKSIPNDSYFNSQYSESFDILLESVTKLIQGFWQFRQEFFGVTIYQSMPTTSVEKLKEFLFDPTLSNEECAKRLTLFKDELNKILSHQVGLLDGYHDSVNDGIESVLNAIDPVILEKKINSESLKLGSVNIPFKYIPFYAKIKSMQMINSIHKKLKQDMSVIERKHFRPAFMKGYQKRIHNDSDSE